LVRRSIAEVTSSIAKMALPAGQWPELLDCMLQLSQSQHAEHREVSLVVFMSLTDSLGDQMRSQFTTLGGIFATGLSDPSAPVRLAALKAVQSLVQWLETPEEMQMGTDMIPRLLTVAQQCLEAGDEDTPIQVFEMLAECAEGSYGIIEGCLANIVKVMIDVAVSERLDIRVRHKAMFVVQELCHLKAKTLKKKNLVDPILKAIFLLSTQVCTVSPSNACFYTFREKEGGREGGREEGREDERHLIWKRGMGGGTVKPQTLGCKS